MLSQMVPSPIGPISLKPLFYKASPDGIEPSTVGLEERVDSHSKQGASNALGQAWANGNALHAASQMLAAVVTGGVTTEALHALADAVMLDERVQLANEVRAGGPDALRRAIELAALLLAGAAKA
jgi:hypothetical protein